MEPSSRLQVCSKCGLTLPHTIQFFPPNKSCRDGLTSQCRTCFRGLLQKWKRRNSARLAEKRRADYAARYGARQRELERARQMRAPYKVKAAAMASGIYGRCRERGWPKPDWLSPTAIEAWLKRQPVCECCGVVFHVGRTKTGHKQPNSPSIDRFDNASGYEWDNVRLICWRCNNIKRDYTANDLRRVADWMTIPNRSSSPPADKIPAVKPLAEVSE